MNTVQYEYIRPTKDMPWYDDYAKHNTLCKVYNDGGCYVAIPPMQSGKKKKFTKSIRMPIDDAFDEAFLKAIKEGISGTVLQDYICGILREAYPDYWGLAEYVAKKIVKSKNNIQARKKRFRRKAFLHTWNYFATFTYDSELCEEEEFRKKLRKCLSNLHSRRGWLYMGVFEKAPDTGRLHFHALLHVPEGQMVGTIKEYRNWSLKQHKMQITHNNDFFAARFGINDFSPLSEAELRNGKTLSYILKYIEKTEERIIYSRGIPSDFYYMVNDNDIVCEMVDFVIKYVLFNDVIDYEEDIKPRNMTKISRKKRENRVLRL